MNSAPLCIMYLCPLQGLILAHSVKYNVETVLNLHTALGRPMGKACALSVCHLVESLKAIEHTYHRHGSLLADSIPHVIQYLTYQILSIVVAAKVTSMTHFCKAISVSLIFVLFFTPKVAAYEHD